MSVLDTATIGQVIPFDQFDYDTNADRLIVPVQNPAFWTEKMVV